MFLLSSLRLGFKQLTFDQSNHEGKKRLPMDTLAGKCCKNGINFMYFNNTWMQLHSLTPLHLKNVGSCVCVCWCVLNHPLEHIVTPGVSEKFSRISLDGNRFGKKIDASQNGLLQSATLSASKQIAMKHRPF